MLKLRQFTLFLGDIIFAYLSLYLTLIIGFWGNFNADVFAKHFFPFSLLYFSWFVIFYILGLYELNFQTKTELASKMSLSSLISFAFGILLFYLVPFFGITPKTNLLINLVLFYSFLFGWRILITNIFASLGKQKIYFLGKDGLTDRIIKKLEKEPQLGYRAGKIIEKDDIEEILKKDKPAILAISEESLKNQEISNSLYKSLYLKINLMNSSKIYEILFKKIPIDFLNQSWFLKNLQEGKKKIYDHLKRVEDIIFSFLVIILTSPLWLIIAIFIKLDDKEKVFYKQERVGKNGKIFLLWKFRSMRSDSEKNGPIWADEKDGRVTKTGAFLRKSHLDELPQMINVFKGDISFVGPRPERPKFVEKLNKEIPFYNLRHIIKPGFTGWAQIKFRYARSIFDSKEKFQYDLYYTKNRALPLDIACILKTLQLFFISPKG